MTTGYNEPFSIESNEQPRRVAAVTHIRQGIDSSRIPPVERQVFGNLKEKSSASRKA